MRRVLLLSYFFPPLGGGGCQRTLKLVRYLEPNGWIATVVTGTGRDYWIRDASLAEEIPVSTEVIRVGGMSAPRLVGWLRRRGVALEEAQGPRRARAFRILRRLQSWLLVPDGYLGWARAAERAALRRAEAGGVDAIWTTSSPESAHLAGLVLKARSGLPWVADFRDPWVGRVTYRPATAWHDRRHRTLERAVVSSADRVTVISDAMADLYRRRYAGLPPTRFVVLPNGVDGDDWRRVAERFGSEDPADRGRFVLLHAGQLAHRPTARTLLDGLRLLLSRDPAAAREIRVRFQGGLEELEPRDWSGLGLGGIVEARSSAPHLEAMAAMRRAAGLLLLGHGGEADRVLYTGKIYEYLTSGRPILAVLDEGPAASLIRAERAGAVCGSRDRVCVAETLEAWLNAWRRGERFGTAERRAGRPQWERAALAARAADLLERLVSPPAGGD